ncbi:MAG: right-handed parallel beta-helix repeat-containing protein, partial [Phycisphaerales bacterium]
MLTPKPAKHGLLVLAIGLGISAANAQTVIPDQAQAWEMARQKGWVIRAETDAGVMELQAIVNGIPRYYITHNAVAADSISTDECLPGGSSGLGLTGAGVTLGVWDADGVRTSHQEFGGRATQVDSPAGTHSHSTHVAGTMIASGVIPSAKGMSPAANLDCYDWNTDETEMRDAATAGLRVSNHSYGLTTGWRFDGSDWYWYGDVTVSTVEDNRFGLYTSDTQEVDDIAYDHRYYLICKSAGNDRDDDGPGPGGGHYYFDPDLVDWVWSTDTRDADGPNDCIGTKGSAKNVLTVAAVGDVPGGYAGPGSVTMSAFSSWGPIDDGRIKPDVSGNGVGLYSTDDDSDFHYTTLSGTSMSAPNVSGSLGVLIEHWRATHPSESDMRSSTLKGLVLHTADEAGPGNGPDYMFGWGLMNTLEAADLISLDAVDPLVINELTLSNGGTFELPISTDGTSSELRATICWTDPPGTPPGNLLDPPDKMLVNDLDLRIERVSPEGTYDPWVLDPSDPGSAATTGDNDTDNVEQVVVYSPGVNDFTVRVTHKGGLSGGSQDFSLVISGMVSPDAYVLTVNITGQGDVALDPPGGVYGLDTPVELTAQAAQDWAFDHWEGHLTGSDNPETVVMNEDKVVTAVFTSVSGTVLYVDDDADPGGNCASWATACKYLQDALAGALTDPTVDEIRVAAGVYKPDQDEGGNVTAGDREATFELINGVAIYGGYAGLANPGDPDLRNVSLYETILSGDLDGDDKLFAPDPLESNCCTPDPGRLGCDNQECEDMVCETGRVPDYTYCCVSPGWDEDCVEQANVLCVGVCVDGDNLENSYHVVTASDTDATALLDGFTITAGNADHPPPAIGEDPTIHRYGAGLYAENGSPTLANCIFAGNSAIETGGGIYLDNGAPTLTDCQFNDNEAINLGGGIYSLNSSLTLTDCLFTGHEPTGGESFPDKGGGLYNEGGNATLIRCTFTDNTALTSGGGMYGADTQSNLIDCTFSGNRAEYGAGLALEDFSIAALDGCDFDAHLFGSGKPMMGGAMWLEYSEATLKDCDFTGNQAQNGGGMALDNYSAAWLNNCQFIGNEALVSSDGGGIYVDWHSQVELTDCTLEGNKAEGNGGGIYCDASMTIIQGTTIRNNEAEHDGGGIWCANRDFPGSVTALNAVIEGNYATGCGAGLYVGRENDMVLDNCTIQDNGRRGDDVTLAGGGIYSGVDYDNMAHVRNDSKILRNEAQEGGGVYVSMGYPLFEDSTIAENKAWLRGGGVYSREVGHPLIWRCRIVQNTAGRDGGGVFLYAYAPPCYCTPAAMSITNSLIAHNSADGDGDGGYGGGILQTAGYLELVSCTIADNTALHGGGGLRGELYLDAYVYNTVLWGNTGTAGPQMSVLGDTLVWSSDVQGGEEAIETGSEGTLTWIDNNIQEDPLFLDPEGSDGDPDNDYHLDVGPPLSPCIDAGDGYAIAGDTDLDGNPRISRCTVDMGAHEATFPPVQPPTDGDEVAKNRYISFVPGTPGLQTAYRVVLT